MNVILFPKLKNTTKQLLNVSFLKFKFLLENVNLKNCEKIQVCTDASEILILFLGRNLKLHY